jgi:hypothetical protein
MDPFTPTLFLTIGAVAIAIGRNRSYGFYGITALVSIAGAIAVILLLGFRLPNTVVLSPWQIASVFHNPLSLTVDKVSWLLGLVLVMATMSLFLTSGLMKLEMTSEECAICLVVVALALLSIFSANLITLILTLTISDIFSSVFVFVLNRKMNLSDASIRHLQIPEMGRLCTKLISIGLVLFVALDDPMVLHTNSNALLIGHASILIIAVMIRLNIYPVNVGIISNNTVSRVVITTISLVNIFVVIDVFASFDLHNYVIPLRSWLTVVGILSGLVGGFRWCIAVNYSGRLYSLLLAQSGITVLIFLWGGNWAVVGVLSHVMAIALSCVVIYIGENLIRSDDSNNFTKLLLTSIVFGCQPVTAGFLGLFVMYSGIMPNFLWTLFVIPSVTITNCLMIIGGLNILRSTTVETESKPAIRKISGILGVGIPLLFSVAIGLFPGRFASLMGLSVLPGWNSLLTANILITLGTSVIALSLAILLWYYRSKIFSFEKYMSDTRLGYVTDLQWVYVIIWKSYRSCARSIQAAGDIIEGQGGVLWPLVIVFAVLLVTGS